MTSCRYRPRTHATRRSAKIKKVSAWRHWVASRASFRDCRWRSRIFLPLGVSSVSRPEPKCIPFERAMLRWRRSLGSRETKTRTAARAIHDRRYPRAARSTTGATSPHERRHDPRALKFTELARAPSSAQQATPTRLFPPRCRVLRGRLSPSQGQSARRRPRSCAPAKAARARQPVHGANQPRAGAVARAAQRPAAAAAPRGGS